MCTCIGGGGEVSEGGLWLGVGISLVHSPFYRLNLSAGKSTINSKELHLVGVLSISGWLI